MLLLVMSLYVNADTIITDLVTNTPAVNTGQGDNELYDMDQNVLTTSDVEFNSLSDGTINCTSGSCTGGSDSNYTNHYQNGVKVLDEDDNTTMTLYVDSQDVVYNTSMKTYVDAVIASLSTVYCALTGCTMAGDIAMGDNSLTGVGGLTATQDVYVGAINWTAENIFVKSDIFLHTDDSSSVVSAGIWQNITFTHNGDVIKQGVNHTYNDNTNDTITIDNTGIYDLKFAANFNDTSANPDDYAYLRVVNNGVEINGSGMYGYLNTKDVQLTISGCVRADLTAGDEIKLQFTGTSTNTNLEAQTGYLDHADSARMCLVRIR